jgi:hypothetical protein
MGDNYFFNLRITVERLWVPYRKETAHCWKCQWAIWDKGKTLINFKCLFYDILSFKVYSRDKWNERGGGLTETRYTEESAWSYWRKSQKLGRVASLLRFKARTSHIEVQKVSDVPKCWLKLPTMCLNILVSYGIRYFRLCSLRFYNYFSFYFLEYCSIWAQDEMVKWKENWM